MDEEDEEEAMNENGLNWKVDEDGELKIYDYDMAVWVNLICPDCNFAFCSGECGYDFFSFD